MMKVKVKVKGFAILLALSLFISFEAGAAGPRAPDLALQDPAGAVHNLSSLLADGGVLVVTAPTMRQGNAQKAWDRYLAATMPVGGALIFVEDMSVSIWKGKAMKDMQRDWRQGVPPLLLIDEEGDVRKALGVERNRTEIFVYDRKGEMIYVYRGAPSAEEAKSMWERVR